VRARCDFKERPRTRCSAHGGFAPITRLRDAETQTFGIEPRRTSATRAALLLYALFATDHSRAIAHLAGMELDGMRELDEATQAAWARLTAGERASDA
jgi:hypothetical protein